MSTIWKDIQNSLNELDRRKQQTVEARKRAEVLEDARAILRIATEDTVAITIVGRESGIRFLHSGLIQMASSISPSPRDEKDTLEIFWDPPMRVEIESISKKETVAECFETALRSKSMVDVRIPGCPCSVLSVSDLSLAPLTKVELFTLIDNKLVPIMKARKELKDKQRKTRFTRLAKIAEENNVCIELINVKEEKGIQIIPTGLICQSINSERLGAKLSLFWSKKVNSFETLSDKEDFTSLFDSLFEKNAERITNLLTSDWNTGCSSFTIFEK